ncbi:hypothetical protein V8F20_006254 [Naviculisporaceae sp. PSN 640]
MSEGPYALAILFASFNAAWYSYNKLYPHHKRTGRPVIDASVLLPIWTFFLVWAHIAFSIILLSIALFGLYSSFFGVLMCQLGNNISPRARFTKAGSGRRKLSQREYEAQLWRFLCFRLWREEGDDPRRAAEARIFVRANPRTGLNIHAGLPEEPRADMNDPNGGAVPLMELRSRASTDSTLCGVDPWSEEIIWVNPLDNHWVTAPNGKAIPPGGELRSGTTRDRTVKIPWEMINLWGVTHAPRGGYDNDGEAGTADVEAARDHEDVELQAQRVSGESYLGVPNAPNSSQTEQRNDSKAWD